jgi:hypothetical protein
MEIGEVFQKISAEIVRARAKHGPFHSWHEAHSVILEEFEEWWDTVKADQSDVNELISVAAMAITAIVELECHQDLTEATPSRQRNS